MRRRRKARSRSLGTWSRESSRPYPTPATSARCSEAAAEELECAGVLTRTRSANDPQVYEYHVTDAGRELKPIVEAFGIWGQRWVDSELSLQHLDVHLLMWDMRRGLNVRPMPKKRGVIQFQYPELPAAQRAWWLLIEPQDKFVDLCSIDPGFDVDLHVSTDLKTMTAIWMGLDTVRRALAEERLLLTGDRDLGGNMQTRLGLSPFAKHARLAG